MKYSVVFSSQTGNTAMLAEAIKELIPAEDLIYFGGPQKKALEADRIYAGFMTHMGSCDDSMGEFLRAVEKGEVFLFGTAGFGGSQDYFDSVLSRVRENIRDGVIVTGQFMCQGKMPLTVRQRYEKMLSVPEEKDRALMLIENFDRAVSHPDADDLQRLKKAVL